ncbi:MAG: hypothetical protein Q9212_001092 [Teloschistes hypoglaucus]
MEVLRRLFGRKVHDDYQNQCRTNDEIFPVHPLDQAAIVRSSVISYTFRYNDVLDAEKLRSSLVSLLEIEGWRKLGGRLRLDANGKLEIHVPPRYTAERPAIRFSHNTFNVPIQQHPLMGRLPTNAGEVPLVHEGCRTFRALSVPDDLPDNIEHYLNNDEPLICLHVTSFPNVTFVSISFPHSIADAMGATQLLRAWSSVLAGKLEDVPPVLGNRIDAVEHVGTSSDEKAQIPFILQNTQIKGLSMLAFAVRFIWDLLTRRKIETHSMFLPAKFVSQLRQVAQDQLRQTGIEKPPFLSDGDIITAYFSRLVMLSRSRKRPAIIMNVFDVRGRLRDTFTSGAAYLQNLILPASFTVPAIDKSAMSFGQIALGLRKAIEEQTTDAQVRSLMKLMKASVAATGSMPIFGSSDSMIIACTNWSKAGLREAANFGPAVIPTDHAEADDKSAAPPGTCVSYGGTTISNKDNPRDTFVIYGKDVAGDYWVHAYLRPESWKLIQDEFGRYN